MSEELPGVLYENPDQPPLFRIAGYCVAKASNPSFSEPYNPAQLSLEGMDEEWASKQIFTSNPADAEIYHNGGARAPGSWLRFDIAPDHVQMIYFGKEGQKSRAFLDIYRHEVSGTLNCNANFCIDEPDKFESPLICAGLNNPFEAKAMVERWVDNEVLYAPHTENLIPIRQWDGGE